VNPTVLLIEDDQNDAFLMKRAFERGSIPADVRLVRDGREALRYLQGQDQYGDRNRHPWPSLTLLDLNLPYVHGLDVLKQIRLESALRKLVVVVLTSSLADSDIEQAYDLGANSYLSKPTGIEQLQQFVELLGQYWLKENKLASSTAAEPGLHIAKSGAI